MSYTVCYCVRLHSAVQLRPRRAVGLTVNPSGMYAHRGMEKMRAWMAVLPLVVALLVVGCGGGATGAPDATAGASPSPALTSTPVAIPIVDV